MVATGCTGPSLIGELSCPFAVIEAGTERVITVYADVRAGELGSSISNTARVNSSTPDQDTGDGEVTVVSPLDQLADLSIAKTGTDAVAGGTATWTIVVSNAGPSDAQSVEVTDLLPASLRDASVIEPVTGCTIIAQLVSCDLGTVLDGGSTTIKIQATVASDYTAASIDNMAAVSAETADPERGSNTVDGHHRDLDRGRPPSQQGRPGNGCSGRR